MNPLLADAVQRFSPDAQTVYGGCGPRSALLRSTIQLGSTTRASDLDELLLEAALRQFSLAARIHYNLMKPHRLLCWGNAMSDFTLRGAASSTVDPLSPAFQFELASFYIFPPDAVDPARELWDALAADSHIRAIRIGEVEVLRRDLRMDSRTVPFFCWSPRPFVSVVVRGESQLAETVRRWNASDPGSGPIPKERPEWKSIDPNSTAWGIRRVHAPVADSINSAVISINPALDDGAVQLTWHGSADFDATVADELFLVPSRVGQYGRMEGAFTPEEAELIGGEHPRVSVRCRMRLPATTWLLMTFFPWIATPPLTGDYV